MTTAYCVTISVHCLLACPVLCQVDGTPCDLHLCVGCVTLCSCLFCFRGLLFCLIVCNVFLWPSVSAFPWVSCVVLAPPAGHRNAGLLVFGLVLSCFVSSSDCVPAPLLAFCLALSCVVLLLVNHLDNIRLIVPANSNLVHPGLGLRPERMHDNFGFVFFINFPSNFSFRFLSVSSLFFNAFFLPFFV